MENATSLKTPTERKYQRRPSSPHNPRTTAHRGKSRVQKGRKVWGEVNITEKPEIPKEATRGFSKKG